MPTMLAADEVSVVQQVTSCKSPNENVHIIYSGGRVTCASKTPIISEHFPWLLDSGTSIFTAKIVSSERPDLLYARKLLDSAARLLPPGDLEMDILIDQSLAESSTGKKATKRSRD